MLVTAAVQRQVAAPKTYLSASPVATKATRRSCTAGCALKAGLRSPFIFISHSGADTEAARGLKRRLLARIKDD